MDARSTAPWWLLAALSTTATAQDQTRHWAFIAPEKPAIPPVTDPGWCRQPLDRFVLRKLEAADSSPSPPADPRTLIRRVTLDLTGLPPTRSEIRAFLADRSPRAYERLVDGLLARPQYGEHMAKYWLDLVRFADTNGVHHDHYREMSPYRDWVIRSFNANRRYDEFVADQLAGDLQPEPTDDQLIASGFNRLHMIIDRGTALPEESYTRNVVDRVTAVGTAFLGLTLQCAVCHDHKNDPITQREFYSLFAFFNNLDAAPETGARGTIDFKRGLQPPYLDLPSAEQAADLRRLDQEIAAASSEERLRKLRRERDAILLEVPAAMIMKERSEPRPAHVLVRGAYDHPGQPVERDVPAALPPIETDGPLTREHLAEWLVSPRHPLTARVAVNRFWQQLFGVGIVKTAEDFGRRGEPPSHPDLLDHLSVTFVESGWDIKALLRRIVLSSTYRQSSAATPAAFARDPDNRLLARGSRFRMDAEMVRDQILATSGRLNPEMYGKSVKPPQPPGIWKAVTLPDSLPRTFTADRGDAIYRRSVYTFWKRGMPPPQMTLLDAPTRESCIARRERTNTPQQALMLMNEAQYLEAARHLAIRTLRDDAGSDADRLAAIYETITSWLPNAADSERLLRLLAELRASYDRDRALARQLCEGAPLGTLTAPEASAWTMLTSAIYNLDITKTRQ